jgi:hypothetical protein
VLESRLESSSSVPEVYNESDQSFSEVCPFKDLHFLNLGCGILQHGVS